MNKRELRALLDAPRIRVAWDDGHKIMVPVPIAVVPAHAGQERGVRFKQGTLYDVRPKPGHDGGTPLTVTARRQIEYKGVRVFKPSRSESDDMLDVAAAHAGESFAHQNRLAMRQALAHRFPELL